MSDPTPVKIPTAADLWPAVVRTIVPFIVGWIASVLLLINVTLTDAQRDSLSGLITLILGALYYIAVRWLEQRFPQLGWLIGSTKQPTYVNDKTIPGDVITANEGTPEHAALTADPVDPQAD